MSFADKNTLLKELRIQLARRGGEASIRTLYRAFRVNDRDKNGKFDMEEFETVLGRVGIFLKSADLHALFKYFDEDGNGSITYDEFLKGVVGELNERRLAIVRKAYNKLDSSGDGKVDVEDMRQTYDASRHPKVLSGELTQDDVFKMMLDSFEGAGGDKDGVVTWDEYQQYMRGISCSYPYNDDAFVQMIENCWKVCEDANPELDDDTFDRLINIMKEKIRTKVKFGKSEQGTAKDTFRYFDTDGSGFIEFHEFQYALERFGLNLNETVCRSFFDTFDYSKSSKINYNEFVNTMYAEEMMKEKHGEPSGQKERR